MCMHFIAYKYSLLFLFRLVGCDFSLFELIKIEIIIFLACTAHCSFVGRKKIMYLKNQTYGVWRKSGEFTKNKHASNPLNHAWWVERQKPTSLPKGKKWINFKRIKQTNRNDLKFWKCVCAWMYEYVSCVWSGGIHARLCMRAYTFAIYHVHRHFGNSSRSSSGGWFGLCSCGTKNHYVKK